MSSLDLSNSGFAVFTRTAGTRDYKVTEINPAANKLFGIKKDHVIRGKDKTLHHAFESVATSGEAEFFSLPTDQNNPGRSQISVTVFKISDSSLATVLNDTAKITQIEDIISRGKQEWEKTVDAIDDIITIMDPEMNIIRANRAAHRVFDYKLGYLVGKKCHEVFHEKDEPCDNCPAAATCRDGKIHRGYIQNDILNRTYDIYSSPIYDENGILSMTVHVARDVTNTIEQEEERRRLSAAIEHASETIVITDNKGTIQYVNPAFSNSTGYTRDEALNQNINILKSGKHDLEFYQQMYNTIHSGKVWNGQLLNKRKDGTIYSEICTISPIFDDDGTISSFVSVNRDVTREESLEKQLQQAIKLEAIGTLAGGIAHDFNNILSAIIGYAQIAKAPLQDNAAALYSINHIISAGERAADLVKQILTFSRQDQSNEPFKPIKAQYIIKEALKLMRSSLPSTIKLTQHIDDKCGTIMADAGQIHQVLINLCTNARQAIGAGYGEIKISLNEEIINSPRKKKPHLLLKPGRYIHIKIADNGSGIEEKIQERIFDPFFTTKPKDHGTGLGLSVVHGIIKKHNGEITFSSRINEGTTFHIFFPIVQAKFEKPGEQPLAIHGGTEHILIVDDELQLTEYLKVALERLRYKITPFTDSLEAIRYFRRNSNEFDLVITDMTMPNMTGAELSREILALRPDLPIIMTTGYHDSFNKEKALRIGIKEFLNKPLRKADLAHSIRKVLDNG